MNKFIMQLRIDSQSKQSEFLKASFYVELASLGENSSVGACLSRRCTGLIVTSGLGQSVAVNFNLLVSSVSGQMQQTTNKVFVVERRIVMLVNNLHKVEVSWEQVITHLLVLAEHGSPQVRDNLSSVSGQSFAHFSGGSNEVAGISRP